MLKKTLRILSKYNLLLNNSQEIIIFFDSTGNIIDCNIKAADELGYGDDIYNEPIYDIFKNAFIYEESKFEINTKFQKSLQETIAYRKNQTCFPVELKIASTNKDKKYIGICTAVNVSKRKEAARIIDDLKNDLNNSSQISSELVARIAHELRTPLNGIMGFGNNLLDTDLKPNQLEAVNIINRCCTNMIAIVNDLLDYAKISNKKMIIEQREFDFHDFIRHIIDFNIGPINEKGLKLMIYISKDIPDRVIGDELRLTQILNNLFSNAVKFTSVGQISLEVINASQTEHYVELFFILMDTGIGIGRDEKDKLFKSFSQVDSSITRRFGGTGLGLAICKKLVEAMHGSIDVDSDKNKGSTFSFTVRLGLPQEYNKNSTSLEDQFFLFPAEENREHNMDDSISDKSDISDIDYISRILKDYCPKEHENYNELMQKALVDFNDVLEKLTICIEMENWEKSEELANRVKGLLPQSHHENSKRLLRLLLAIRKENHDQSLEILNEIKANMYKEK